MKHLALYNTATKIAQFLEDYSETDTTPEGDSLYIHNLSRFMAEARNRGSWSVYNSDTLFSTAMPTYSGGAQPNSLLLIGDSRTFMWKTTATKFFTEYSLVDNRGVPGDTALNQCAVVPTWGLPMYKKAIISIGINDYASSYIQTINALAILVSHIKQRAETVYLTSIPCVNAHLVNVTGLLLETYNRICAHAMQTNTLIPSLCATSGIKYIDLFSALDDIPTGTLKVAYDDGGGIHYNDAGYAAIRALYAQNGI